MNNEASLNAYMNRAIKEIIGGILRGSLKNPKETAFVLRMKRQLEGAAERRATYEKAGQHIPPFLISSIATQCNLHCAGCYARADGSCGTGEEEMTADQWARIFAEASELGIAFNLLAGGEPLLRKDVLVAAAKTKSMVFPVFTNGLLIDDALSEFFRQNRNLIPIISLEGNQTETDKRRGDGTYNRIVQVMESLKKAGVLFGTSITLTTANLVAVTEPAFMGKLYEKGCQIAFYVEYVPVDEGTKALAPAVAEREIFEARLTTLRRAQPNMALIAFPGDEKYMGGCLAAGRGFFHINAQGGAEACPFSPHSDTSLKEGSLLAALKSPFFSRLRTQGLVGGAHDGGCALFAQKAQVEKLLMGE